MPATKRRLFRTRGCLARDLYFVRDLELFFEVACGELSVSPGWVWYPGAAATTGYPPGEGKLDPPAPPSSRQPAGRKEQASKHKRECIALPQAGVHCITLRAARTGYSPRGEGNQPPPRRKTRSSPPRRQAYSRLALRSKRTSTRGSALHYLACCSRASRQASTRGSAIHYLASGAELPARGSETHPPNARYLVEGQRERAFE